MFGPFKTEKAGKIIMNLAKDKLLPAVTDLEKLAIEVADFKISLSSSFYRRKLNLLDSRYRKQNKNFFALYHLYSTPDDLFNELKSNGQLGLTKEDAEIIADYFSSKQMMPTSFGEGFKLLETIERQLSRYYQSADQRVATILATIAIAVSIIAAVWRA